MPVRTTLLVSRHPRVIHQVQQAHDGCDLLRLEICGVLEKARSRLLGSNLALVLLHITPESDLTEVRGLLREAAANPGTTTALVCDDGPAARHGRDILREGAAHLVCLPSESAKLIEIMNAIGRHPAPAGVGQDRLPPAAASERLLVEPEHLAQLRLVADQETTVLLTGETGTGKTVLARYIHQLSGRRDRPFMMVDCGALAPALIESEMFGHVRGAFTGADKDRVGKFAASGDGTLVLDEINSLPLALQSKLLRAVEERAFEPVGSNQTQPLRARIIAISNVSLREEVTHNRFRADLFYRLNVIGFRLPTLRERGEVLALARKFLAENPVARERGVIGVSPEALDAMEAYKWPGNIRELKNVIERVAVLCPGRIVGLTDLPESVRTAGAKPPAAAVIPVPVTESLADGGPDDELWRICEALRKHRNNRARAAAELGMSRVSLYKKLHKYGLFDKTAVH